MPQRAPIHRPHGKGGRQPDRRGTSAERGYDATWQKLRLMHLAEYPLCDECARSGKARPASEVHHIESIREAPELRLDMDNLTSLCHRCHMRLENKET